MPMNQSRIHHAGTRKKQPRFHFLIDKARTYTRAVLLLVCAVILFTSCSAKQPTKETMQTTDNDASSAPVQTLSQPAYSPVHAQSYFTQAQSYFSQLATMDLGGEILVITSVVPDPISEDQTALDAYRQQRRAMIEQAFHCAVLVLEYDADDLYEEMVQDREQNTGTGLLGDLLLLPQEEIGRFSSAGLLADIRSLPYVDLSAPYFDQKAMDQIAAGNRIYAVAGDFTQTPQRAVGVFYNRSLLSSLGSVNVQQLYQTDTWTWDQFLSLCQAAQNSGLYGYQIDESLEMSISQLIVSSAGYHPVQNALDTTPTVTGDASRQNEIASTVFRIWNETTRPDPNNEVSARDQWLSGNAPFYIAPLSEMETMAQTGMDWGLLPLPKVGTGQTSYFSPLTSDAPLLCVAADTQNTDLAGMLVQALNASSYGYLEEYYLYHVLSDLAPDNLTALSVSHILSGSFYDFCDAYASGYPLLKQTLIDTMLNGASTSTDSTDPTGEVQTTLNALFRARTP